jgi:hypothetical protein
MLEGNLSLTIKLRLLPSHTSMQIIPEEIRTIHAPMSIKDPKISNLLPLLALLGFRNIQYNRNSILIIISDGALIGTG